MLEPGDGKTQSQAKKSAAFVRRAFQGENSLVESVALLPAVPRIRLTSNSAGVARGFRRGVPRKHYDLGDSRAFLVICLGRSGMPSTPVQVAQYRPSASWTSLAENEPTFIGFMTSLDQLPLGPSREGMPE